MRCILYVFVAVSCVEGWCCVLGWCPFYSLGVVSALCSQHSMCIDPGVWRLLSWLGYTTLAVVPLVWLCGDSWVRAEVPRLLVPGVCTADDGRVEVALKDSSAGSTISTEFTTVERIPLPRDFK